MTEEPMTTEISAYDDENASLEYDEETFSESDALVEPDNWYMEKGSVRGASLFSPGAVFACTGRMSRGTAVNLITSSVFGLFFFLASLFEFFPIPLLLCLIGALLLVWCGFALFSGRGVSSAAIGGRLFIASFSVVTFWFPMLVAFVFGFGFVMQRTWMGNDTMMPSIHKGDYVLVDRMHFVWQAPQRGELVLVEDGVASGRSPRAYFARVIALPGDTIQLRGGAPVVNERSLSQYTHVSDVNMYQYQPGQPMSVLLFEVPAQIEVNEANDEPERWYPVQMSKHMFLTQTESLTLEPAQYFVLEDNRDDLSFRHIKKSYGSIIHVSRIKGQPRFILYNSIDKTGFERFGEKLR